MTTTSTAPLHLEAPGIVFSASGQGSQKPGMGLDLLDLDEVAAAFDEASAVLGRDLATLIAKEDPTELNRTENAQFAIVALSIGIGRALMTRGIMPQAVLGFSLGQISAMALAGMMSDREAFELLAVRARSMAEASEHNPGVMSALLKRAPEDVEALVAGYDGSGTLVVANYNSPVQTVVSGSPEAVEWAETQWTTLGGRVSRLNTSGAFHSPLMAQAQAPLAAHLATLTFREPAVPVIANHTAAPLTAKDAAQALVDHLTHPVYFTQSVKRLIAAGATRFIEVGYGGVLTKLLKRIDESVERVCVQDKASFQAVCP